MIGRGANYGDRVRGRAEDLGAHRRGRAEPSSSADFLHGPIAIVEPGFPILAIAPSGADAGAAMRDVLERRARAAPTSR